MDEGKGRESFLEISLAKNAGLSVPKKKTPDPLHTPYAARRSWCCESFWGRPTEIVRLRVASICFC